MAFSTGMSPLLVIFGTGLLTVSYQGLFDLAKQFLDPYDNESYGRGEDPLCVDTLIAETNAGSIRWLYGFEEMPFSAQRLNDGELYEYLLPVRGYSVKELDDMEKDRSEREKYLEEQRKREDEEAAAAEVERLKKEAEAEAEKEVEMENVDMEERQGIDEEDAVTTIIGKDNVRAVEIAETTDALVTELPISDDDSTIEITQITGNTIISEIEEQIVSPTLETNANVTEPPVPSTENTIDNDEMKETRPVHKVTTLATDGSLISSFKSSQPIKPFIEEPVPSGMQTSNYLATLRMENERIKTLLAAADVEDDDLEEQMINFEAFEDLPWFEEVGSDGQEFRLSQQLADENFVEEVDDIQIRNITKEEYEERLKEIEQNAENELKETIEVMSAIPGTDGNLYTVTERRKKKAPSYDQTRLDGISQLWGLPPEDPASLSEYVPPEKIDDVDFGSISQLWGGNGLSDALSTTSTQNTRQDESEVVGMGSFAGISELWGSTLNDFQDDVGNREIDPVSRNETISDSDEQGNDDVDDFVGSSFAGLPWHKEKGPDGKEFRLSQMLAEEEWVSESDPDEVSRMTLEDYNEKVQEITEKLEEELKETEAILLSKPGTDPVGWDYDDEDLTPMSNVTATDEIEEEEKIGRQNNTIAEDADLSVLEMDVEMEEEFNAADVKSDDDVPIFDDVTKDDDTNPTTITDSDVGANDLGDIEFDSDGVDALNEVVSKMEIMTGKKDTEIDTTAQIESSKNESSETDETTSNDGKNKIKPIFLEEDSPPVVEGDGEEEDDLRL